MNDGSDRETPPWRVGVAAGVVALLLVGVFLASRGTAENTSPDPPATTSAVATGDDSAGSDVSGTTGSGSDVADEVVAAAAAALDAWAVFAATGDAAVLADRFVVDGPQHRQLVDEVGALGADPSAAYRFELVEPEITGRTGDAATVRATVRFTDPGGESFDYRWDIELSRTSADDHWRLWTVATVSD